MSHVPPSIARFNGNHYPLLNAQPRRSITSPPQPGSRTLTGRPVAQNQSLVGDSYAYLSVNVRELGEPSRVRRGAPTDQVRAVHAWTVGRTTTSLISTPEGCSIAKPMAVATAEGGMAISSR